ncbi:MAG: hypothetical protein IJY37_02615 [Clostridia bacterium]|nr:hypothetical protein [Clostridia bacterium]
MTKKEFTYALPRGLGRCVLACRKDPEKYRDIVWKHCDTCDIFDAQCNGTHTWYWYQLICCYEDKEVFIQKIVDAFLAYKPKYGWEFYYDTQLLTYFADDGIAFVEKALWQKYEELYMALLHRKRAPRGMFHLRNDFETLCVELATDFERYLRIATDIGRLYLENSLYDAWDFEWLYSSVGQAFQKRLLSRAKASEPLAHYIRIHREQEESKPTRNDAKKPLSELKGWGLSYRLMDESAETVGFYAQKYLDTTDIEARTEALLAFTYCPYPLDPAPIIEDTKSENEKLADVAWEALACVRHPKVRELALAHLTDDFERAFPLFVCNYLPEDEECLTSILKHMKIDVLDTSGWHHAHFAVYDMFEKRLGVPKPPKKILPILYETTLCPSCRKWCLELMAKYRMITPEIRKECAYDCYEDTRKAYGRRDTILQSKIVNEEKKL